MKLYDSFGMNPRMVRFFLLEKEMDVDRTEIDILKAENRQPAYLAVNPAGQTPALQLDDGRTIAETYAICEYLEEKKPRPSLIGTTPEERAETRMWWRRAELGVCRPMVQGFYYAEGLELFKERLRCLPEAAEGVKAQARDGMLWIDEQLRGRSYLCGERFSVADICLYCYMDQLRSAGQPAPREAGELQRWFDGVASRPAADRSVWREQPMGMRG